MKLRLIPVIFAALLSISVLAQSDYDEGITAFLENDREAAIEFLTMSIEDGKKVPESHLALSLIYSSVEKSQSSFAHFMEFMAKADDPYPYLIALWSSGDIGFGGSQKDDVRLEFIETLLNKPDLPGKLRAMCYSALGRHYKQIDDFGKALDYSQNIGQIQHWSSVGPFENISASGFNKDFGAVSHPEPTHSFKSTYGATIKWFENKGPKVEQWMDNEYAFESSNAIIYAQSFVKSPRQQKVQFRLGVGGSVKMWLNDHLIFEEAVERDNDIDTYIIETTLAKGNNRILIQIGESEVDNSNFLLRITDEDGNNIEDLSSEPFGMKYDKSKPESRMLPNYEEAYFEKLLEKDDAIINHILLAKAYIRNGKKYQARKTLNHAIEQAPNSSYLKLTLAYVYISEGNRTGLATILSWLKQNDLNNPVSLSLTFSEALKNEHYETADSILDAYQMGYGNSVSYYDRAIKLADQQEQSSRRNDLIREAYKYYRDYGDFVRMSSLIEGKKSKAIKTVKKYLKKNYDYDMYSVLANHYFQAKSVQGGLLVFQQLAEKLPYMADPRYTLADIYFAVQVPSMALDYIEEAIEIAPYNDEYWGLKGKILEAMEDYAEAEDAYKRCIELYPNNYEIREKLRLLNEEKSLYDLFTSEDLEEVFKNSPSKDDYPADNSLILRHHTENIVYKGGGSEQKITLLVKVFNSKGIDDWKEYTIPVYNFQQGIVEKVEVLKKDGTKLEAERDGAYVVFTNLEPDDAILIVYRVKNHYFGKLAFNFWDQHKFTSSTPYLEKSYSLLIHKDVDFKHTFSNGGFDPVVETKGEYVLYRWAKTNEPSVKREDYMSRYVDFGEALFISTFPDWNYISNWYSDLAAAKSKPDYEVKEVVAELFEGRDAVTDKEKVEIIYNYIVKNIRYSSVSFRQSGLIPQKATSVLNTKIGDCKDVSTLFVAMCKEAGIEDVGLVLVNTRDNGQKDLMLPSISFNHCIGRVGIDGEVYYVELTSENFGFMTYGDNLLNSFVLEIYDETQVKQVDGFIFDPKNRNPNNILRTASSKINGKNLEVEVKNVKTGNWGSYMRYIYKDESDEKRRELILKALNEDHKNVKLNELSFVDFDTLINEFEYNYSFVIENHVSQIAGLNIFVLPWSNTITSAEFVSDEDRTYPLELWKFMNYDKTHQEITVTLPSGSRLAERPKNVYIDNEFATYKITYKIVGNKITAVRELIPKMQVVDPKDFEKLKAFISVIIENDTKNIAYR